MKITVFRYPTQPEYTEGEMFVNGQYFGHVLEDTVRAPGVKVDGKTAIPAGKYAVTVDHSPKFGKDLPRLHDVPGFDGVLIHGGNTADDSLGCLLLAKDRNGPGKIYGSLSSQLTAALSMEPGPHEIRIYDPR